MAAYGALKTKEIVKILALKVVPVACEKWSFTRGSIYGDLSGKLLVFQKTWSLRGGGRNRRFDCISSERMQYLKEKCKLLKVIPLK